MMDNNNLIDRLPADIRRLAEIAGVDAALKFCSECGGTWIYIPKLDGLRRELRDQAIRESFDNGRSVRELCRDHNLSDRQIYTILNSEPAEGKSFTLPLNF